MKTILIALIMIFSLSTVNCQRRGTDFRLPKLKDSAKINTQGYFPQNKDIAINISTEINFKKVGYMELYKINLTKGCDQSKAVSIVYQNKIAKCFDYMKTIKGREKDNFIRIIRDYHTYGGDDVACFDTDYGLLLYGYQNEIVGYINISKSCNKLVSNPEIKERTYYAHDGLRLIGFSKKGRKNIEKVLGI